MKFGVMYDFRNPKQWRRPYPELYAAMIDQAAMLDELGYDNVWLTEHHFVDDGYNPATMARMRRTGCRASASRSWEF